MSLKSLPDFFHPVISPTYSDWVEQDCDGNINKASAYIPFGFESYIHICHPFWQWPENCGTKQFKNLCEPEQIKHMSPMRWRDSTKARQLPFDGTLGWSNIQWQINYGEPSPGDIATPLEGTPSVDIIKTIENAVATVTPKQEVCVCAFWFGFQYFKFPPTEALHSYGQGPYFLMQGPLEKVFGYWAEQIDRNCLSASSWSPQAVWSANRDWFYAAPFRNRSSLFGGTKSMTSQIVNSSEVEAYHLPDIRNFRF